MSVDLDQGTDVGSIWSLSGDTEVLADDSEFYDASKFGSCAFRLARGLNGDGEQESALRDEEQQQHYVGQDHIVTPFERKHFHPDNITPHRPHAAFFLPAISALQKVFESLKKLNFPPKSIQCLQRRVSGDMLITFATAQLKERSVCLSSIQFQDGLAVINNDDQPLMFLNGYDAPHELSDNGIILRLKKYCSTVLTRCSKYANSDFCNGICDYRVRKFAPIPSYLRFGKFIRLSHDGQLHTCRRCN